MGGPVEATSLNKGIFFYYHSFTREHSEGNSQWTNCKERQTEKKKIYIYISDVSRPSFKPIRAATCVYYLRDQPYHRRVNTTMQMCPHDEFHHWLLVTSPQLHTRTAGYLPEASPVPAQPGSLTRLFAQLACSWYRLPATQANLLYCVA